MVDSVTLTQLLQFHYNGRNFLELVTLPILIYIPTPIDILEENTETGFFI